MSYFSSQFAPHAVVVAMGFLAVNASAQMPHNHAAMGAAKPTASVPVAPSAANALRYESVFARYKSYRDEKTGAWREANETVERVGGWRAYAREAQQPDSTTPAAPAKPDPHAGHGAQP